MSTTLRVRLAAAPLPDAEALIAAIRLFGADCAFPQGFDLAVDEGYIPCTLAGHDTGFEYTREDGELFLESRHEAAAYAAAALTAAAIAQVAGAALIEDDDLPPLQGDAIAAWAREIDVPPKEEPALLRVPVSVEGPRGNGFLQLKLGRFKGAGSLPSRLFNSIDTRQVPPDLRLPNSRFVIVVNDDYEIVGVERR